MNDKAWLLAKDALSEVNKSVYEHSYPTFVYHLQCGNIHAVKMNIGGVRRWCVYKPSLEMYIDFIKKKVYSEYLKQKVEIEEWRWQKLLQAGKVKNPPAPTLADIAA